MTGKATIVTTNSAVGVPVTRMRNWIEKPATLRVARGDVSIS